jgi:hypothetical protein
MLAKSFEVSLAGAQITRRVPNRSNDSGLLRDFVSRLVKALASEILLQSLTDKFRVGYPVGS